MGQQASAARKNSLLSVSTLLWTLLAASLLPWLLVRVEQATNSDILWLCEALSRYFGGLRLSEAAYETNPPLSLLIYTLPVLAESILHIPLHYAVFAQSCILVGVSALAVFQIISAWNLLHRNEIFIITAAYILANTLGASLYFGERDHLIGIVLLPFVLMQLTITYGLPQAKGWKWPVLIFGALFILLKPHHGLLPTLLLLHRVILKRKILPVFKDADFLSLAALTSLYIASVIVFFPDYTSIILPDAINLYTTMGEWKNVRLATLFLSMACALIAAALYFLSGGATTKNLSFFMILASLISIIPYDVQGLGFYYHLMPAVSFFACAAAMALFLWIKSQAKENMAVILAAVFMVTLSYLYAPLNIGYPKHGDYADLPVTKILEKECPHNRPCSFFMFNNNMGIVHETAYYTGIHHASRFPSLWFMPEIIKGKQGHLSKEETERYYTKYSNMIAEDLSSGKPDVVLIWKSDASFLKTDFVEYFSHNQNFKLAWKHYKKIGSTEINYAEYFTGTRANNKILAYDIYRRTAD